MCKISLLGVTINFDQSAYIVNENDVILQPVITLSNPAAFSVRIRIRDNTMTAQS